MCEIFLHLKIASAILFVMVLINFALNPTSEPIMSPQKKLAKAHPIIDLLHVCVVQFFALTLSMMQTPLGEDLQ